MSTSFRRIDLWEGGGFRQFRFQHRPRSLPSFPLPSLGRPRPPLSSSWSLAPLSSPQYTLLLISPTLVQILPHLLPLRNLPTSSTFNKRCPSSPPTSLVLLRTSRRSSSRISPTPGSSQVPHRIQKKRRDGLALTVSFSSFVQSLPGSADYRVSPRWSPLRTHPHRIVELLQMVQRWVQVQKYVSGGERGREGRRVEEEEERARDLASFLSHFADSFSLLFITGTVIALFTLNL